MKHKKKNFIFGILFCFIAMLSLVVGISTREGLTHDGLTDTFTKQELTEVINSAPKNLRKAWSTLYNAPYKQRVQYNDTLMTYTATEGKSGLSKNKSVRAIEQSYKFPKVKR